MKPQADFKRGVLAMIGSNLMFTLMAVLIRVDPSTNAFEAAFYRFAIGAAMVASLALAGRSRLVFHDIRGLVLRGLIGGLSVVLFYLPINAIGLARTSLFQYAYPFYAILFSAIFMKEKVSVLTWVLVAVGFGGLVVLNLPDLAGGSLNWMVIFAFASGVTSGLAVMFVKKLSATETSTSIFLAQCIGGFWIMVVPANWGTSPSGALPALLLLGIGLSAGLGQLSMTWAYKHVDVSTGSMLGTLVPVLNIIAGILFFGEKLGPLEILGAVITLGSCTLLVLAKAREQGSPGQDKVQQ